MSLNTIDLILTVLIVASLVLGWRKGLIAQASTILAVIGGIIAARLWGEPVGEWLVDALGRPEPGDSVADAVPKTVFMAGYVAVFGLAWLWIKLLARMVRSAAKVVLLGWADQLGGALFMCFKWCLALSITLNIYALAAPKASQQWGTVACAVTEMAPRVWGMIMDNVSQMPGAFVIPLTDLNHSES